VADEQVCSYKICNCVDLVSEEMQSRCITRARVRSSGVSGDRSPRRARLVRGYVYRTRFPRRRVDLRSARQSGRARARRAAGRSERSAGVSAGKGPMPTRQCENAREADLYSP
jgi:hypothetical protein